MRPWKPLHVEDATDGQLVVYGNGDKRRDIDVHPSKEQYELMRQGLICIRCFEPQETPFPETCGLRGCDGYPDGFPMRERQRQVMDEMFDEIRRPSLGRTVLWLPGKDDL